MTPREIAAKCQLNYRTVLRAIEAGELPASRLRGRLRVSEDDFAEWISVNRVEPMSTPGYDIRPKTATETNRGKARIPGMVRL